MVLKALVLRPILRETLRTAATVFGIAIGVAVVVAIQLANQSALRAFRESIDAVSGRANYTIAADSPLSEDVLLKLQPMWDEGLRFAPVIDEEGLVVTSQLPVRLLAVDLLSDLHFREYKYAEIAVTPSVSEGPGGAGGTGIAAPPYPPGPSLSLGATMGLFLPDSAIVPAPFARDNQLVIGSPLVLDVRGHTATLRVRGILEARGPATAFNGAIVVCDIAAAQRSFGMEGKLTRVDLLVPDERLVPRIRSVLPPHARLERPSRRNERVENMLRAFRVNLFALAGVALLVGMFLVYNTVLISILRRRRDVATLKILGVAPRQIFAAFLGEGLLFGLAGSALGIALGDGLARGILALIGRTINSLYVTSRPEAVTLTPSVIALGVAVGTILSLASAIHPSLEAARMRPKRMEDRRWRRSGAGIAAIACFIAGAACTRLPPARGIAAGGYLAVLFVVAGFSLLAPAILRATTAITRAPLRRAFGIVGQLASATLPASLRRTSVAGAALSLAIGMMVAVALMVGSFRETVRVWVNQTIRSDMWLRPAKGLMNAPSAAFPPRIADDLRKVPFIEAIDRGRGIDLVYRDQLIGVGSGDFDVAAKYGDLPMVAPRSARDAFTKARRTNGVFVSESFASKFGKGLGDTVQLPSPHGTASLPIAGIYRDYSSDRGTVILDHDLFARTFDDQSINNVIIFLKPGVDREWARRQLEKTFGPKYHAFAVTNGSIRREVMTIFDQTFLITYALLGVAIAVAVLGIINTLAALILERTRELALLRVLGVTRGELRTTIVLESSLLGAASTAAGLVMGYVLSWILINVINKQSFGWTIEFHAPAALIAASLAVTFLAASLAGLVPARLADRIDFGTAVKVE